MKRPYCETATGRSDYTEDSASVIRSSGSGRRGGESIVGVSANSQAGEHIVVCYGPRTRRYVSRISPEGVSPMGAEQQQLHAEFRPVGCCDGLWCLQLSDDRICKFVIANPTTSQLRHLPPIGIENTKCGESSCRCRKCSMFFEVKHALPMCALGFDSRNEDFKLLVCVRTAYYDLEPQITGTLFRDHTYASRHCISKKIFIYSLKSNTWKECKELACPWEWRVEWGTPTSFQSVCYWALEKCVLSFDFCDEKFTDMPYPPDIWNEVFINYVIIDLLGSVGAVTYMNFGGSRFFRFWVLDGDGRTWKRKMEYDVYVSGVCKPLALGVSRSGHGPSCCWFLGREDILVQYDYATKQTKTLYQFCDYFMTLFPHMVNNLNLSLHENDVYGDMFESLRGQGT